MPPDLHPPRSRILPAAGLAPAAPVWVIGDVHGRADLLEPILSALCDKGEDIVLVGDYVNKGPDSAAALRLIQTATQQRQVIALRGNHEDLLLKFIAKPRMFGETWLRYGGAATLDSFGIKPLPINPTPRTFGLARNALVEAMGGLVDWLGTLPYLWQSGNVVVVHAGLDPHAPVASQPEKACAWGHPDFGQRPRQDNLWVVHGHRIVPDVTVRQGQISVDTGAFASDRLSAIRLSHGKVEIR